ncbi:response regulator [Defluviimonas sp. SAOS-178_SWC]|uniref:response regulator n=1 Tax=Defluviimonas sp. SAOS-178_SWC TaxID=3121287 RepID=UPI003222218E
MKILAVDDDAFIRELLPMVLASKGFQDITVAASGVAALELIGVAEPAFDCLLLDIHMPEMDGIELCTRVRQLSAYRRTPIIMLTAMTERRFVDAAFAAGATDYVTKPFETMELGIRVRNAEELITARRAASETTTSAPLAAKLMSAANKPDLSEVQIEGVSGLVDYPSLRNYLKQLSRSGLLGSQIVAIKVENIEKIHGRASAEELTYALTDIAEAIADTLRGQGLLIANAGGGLFICVSSAPHMVDPSNLESEIQSLLDEKQSAYDDGTPMDIDVSVGIPIRPGSHTSSDPDEVLDRAIARAESRAQVKQKPCLRLNIRRPGGLP